MVVSDTLGVEQISMTVPNKLGVKQISMAVLNKLGVKQISMAVLNKLGVEQISIIKSLKNSPLNEFKPKLLTVSTTCKPDVS